MMLNGREVALEVQARAERRRQQIDRLLPRQIQALPGCDQRFTATDPGGQPLATARCEHRKVEPVSLDLVWGARWRFRLVPDMAGPGVADALGQLIRQWKAHLADVPEATDSDTASIVHWPSRDIEGFRPVLDHGLIPLTVLAARETDRNEFPRVENASQHLASPGEDAAQIAEDDGAAHLPPDSIRQAGSADLDVVADLALREIRYDTHFGAVDRPEAADAMKRYVGGLLAEPDPWIWLAERDGSAVGVLIAERPQAARWIAPLTALSPVAYLMSMFVLPAMRGSGIGGVLARRFHREVAAAGVAVTLLHYELFNPLSMPFWSRQGYRPLWTELEARPALSLRCPR